VTEQWVGTDWHQDGSGLLVPAHARPARKPVAVDLFAGAGGFSCGFAQAGWHVAAAVEYDRDACATYLANLGGPSTVLHVDDDSGVRTAVRCSDRDGFSAAGTGWITSQPGLAPLEHMWQVDVRRLTGREVLDALGMKPGELDAVMGGPPCPGFSVAGRRDVMDIRNALVFDFARLVVEMQPKTFVMENVTGLLTMMTPEGVPVIDALALVFADGGFGTYDAMKRTLAAQAGSVGGLKSTARPEKRRTATAQEQPDALFEMEPA
jgi:DNA (cytosine-5)-methyltransferase 1